MIKQALSWCMINFSNLYEVLLLNPQMFRLSHLMMSILFREKRKMTKKKKKKGLSERRQRKETRPQALVLMGQTVSLRQPCFLGSFPKFATILFW